MATIQYFGPRRFLVRFCLAHLTGRLLYRQVIHEIEIRFQFQRCESKREAGLGQAAAADLHRYSPIRILLPPDQEGGQKGNCEFVMSGNRIALAGAVLRRTADYVCQRSVGLNEVEVSGCDVL